MQSSDWRHRLKSGEIIDVEVTSHTLLFGRRPAVVVSAQDITVRHQAEAALAERAALTTVSAEVGAALNRLGDVRAGMQGCAEAIVAHLDLEIVEIALINPITGVVEAAATAGDLDAEPQGTLTAREWPLEFGHRSVGKMVLLGRMPLTEGTVAGLTSIAAMIALGVTRHQAEDARRLLAAMVASSDEAIYGTNRNGTVVTWNAGAERVFGYTAPRSSAAR